MENCGPDPTKCYSFKSGRKGRLGKLKQRMTYALRKVKKDIPSLKRKPSGGGDIPPPTPRQSHVNPNRMTTGGLFK